MLTVVGIRFKKAGKIYYFDPGGMEINAGEHVIVETARGLEFGDVVVGPRQVEDSQIVAPLKPVLRKATPEDEEKVNNNRKKEKEAFKICEQKILAHDLPMNLVDVEYTLM